MSRHLVALVGATLFLCFQMPASADHLVEKHQLDCSSEFPCPPELQRRIDFWIMVFRRYGTEQVIFHDSKRPERLYSALKTKQTCRRKRGGRRVERERQRIRKLLQQIATKMKKKNAKYTQEETHLKKLFAGESSAEIRRASNRIRCQQGNRDRFEQALIRYGTYKQHVLKVLRENKLPEDIQYLPFVESAYNPKAYSRVGAAGLWQIMPRTARKLGLQINSVIDERFDPEAATWAAARYLRNSTDSLTALAKTKDSKVTVEALGPFIITSYNYGVTGMRRAIKKIGPDYMEVLRKYKSRRFRTAVRNFYSSFIAARYVASNSSRYFGPIQPAAPLRYKLVAIKRPTSIKRIKKVFGVAEDQLKVYNPALTRWVWRGRRLVPKGYPLRLPHRDDSYAIQIATLERLQEETPKLSGEKYRVQRGDTACGVAKAFQVSCRELIAVNTLGHRATIHINQKLLIPGKPKAKGKAKQQFAKAKIPKSTVASPTPTQPKTAVVKAVQVSKLNGAEKKTTPEVASSQEPGSKVPVAAGNDDPWITRLNATGEMPIGTKTKDGHTIYRIRVEPEETLGHYADWLGGGTTHPIRRLNGLKHGQQLRMGQSLRLPIKGENSKQLFIENRREYHRTLSEEFQEHYQIVGIENYTVKRGDNLWKIAEESELPFWVLTRFNPMVQKRAPNVGEVLQLPKIRAKRPQQEAPTKVVPSAG